ncbi:arylesterase [Pseudoalteromonas sp. MTN2-4]|uniref:arylesterase n=1 Tax=Pseudoalteromonas sp. MTN2-4 TaxID=3056555 RepID=UPI0036F1A348
MLREFLKLAVFLAFLLISSTSFAKGKIMIIGDSLSAGYGLEQEQAWVYLLQNKYKQEQSDIEIINTAISGQTTDNAILKIDAWLQAHKPTHVLVELGGNDGIRGFPVKILRKNLTTLVEKSQAAGAKVAVMAIQIPPNLGPRYTKMFSDTYKKVTDATDSYLMPYFMVEIATDKLLMMQDNLHPNAEAQPIIRDFMYREFNTWLGK